MEKLTKQRFENYDYISRYTGVPYYYDPITRREIYGIGEQIRTDLPFVSHKLKPEDNLDSLALTYYNNPTFWWVIAYFNDIPDAFMHLQSRYSTLKIPRITGIEFGRTNR
jgi:hypothetical protein